MKKLLLLLALSLTFLACSDDDDFSDSVTGKWGLTSSIIDGKESLGECDLKNSITFSSDNTCSSIVYTPYSNFSFESNSSIISCIENNFKGTYQLMNGNITLTFLDEDKPTEIEIHSYKIENDNLIIFGDDYAITYKKL